MLKPLHPTDAQKQVLTAALKMFLDAKVNEVQSNSRTQHNEYDLLDPKHCVMHSMALLKELTGQPMAYFMNPIQVYPPSPDVATSQPTPETSHPSSLENHTGLPPNSPPPAISSPAAE